MSYSSNTTATNTIGSSQPLSSAVKNKELASSITDMEKLTTPNNATHNQDHTTTVFDLKFVSASQLVGSVKTNEKTKPEEITDEELLQMALMFEKKHPEYASIVRD